MEAVESQRMGGDLVCSGYAGDAQDAYLVVFRKNQIPPVGIHQIVRLRHRPLFPCTTHLGAKCRCEECSTNHPVHPTADTHPPPTCSFGAEVRKRPKPLATADLPPVLRQ